MLIQNPEKKGGQKVTRKEFYEGLSDEMKARLKACKSEKEMLEVLAEGKVEIDPELLEGAAGGRRCPDYCTFEWC